MSTKEIAFNVVHQGSLVLNHSAGYGVLGNDDAVCFFIDVPNRGYVDTSTFNDANCPVLYLSDGTEQCEHTVIEFPEFPGWVFHSASGGKSISVAFIRRKALHPNLNQNESKIMKIKGAYTFTRPVNIQSPAGIDAALLTDLTVVTGHANGGKTALLKTLGGQFSEGMHENEYVSYANGNCFEHDWMNADTHIGLYKRLTKTHLAKVIGQMQRLFPSLLNITLADWDGKAILVEKHHGDSNTEMGIRNRYSAVVLSVLAAIEAAGETPVLIDNLDAYLSPKSAGFIFQVLAEKVYAGHKFVVSIGVPQAATLLHSTVVSQGVSVKTSYHAVSKEAVGDLGMTAGSSMVSFKVEVTDEPNFQRRSSPEI